MTIRAYQPSDLAALHTINQASTPGVGHAETPDDLARLLEMGTCLVATDENDAPLGFINLVDPGTAAYDSDNLRWYEAWMAENGIADMAYVDRIALGPSARNRGLGQDLYKAVFEQFSARGLIGCEVNDDPPNPGSRRFHERLGFESVGTQRYRPDYAVRFFVRKLG